MKESEFLLPRAYYESPCSVSPETIFEWCLNKDFRSLAQTSYNPYDVLDAMLFGAKKYGLGNWAGGLDPERLRGSAMRHAYAAWVNPNAIDEDSGCLHRCGMQASCVMMLNLFDCKGRSATKFDENKAPFQALPLGFDWKALLPDELVKKAWDYAKML